MTAPSRTRPRVLVIAEAANPEWVSVPLEGWSSSRALAGVADVHLVTQVRNRDAIARAGLVEGRDFTAIDSEAIARPAYRLGERLRGGRGLGHTTVQAIAALTYPFFERLAWKAFGPRIVAGEFDIVHRVTPLSPTNPSPIAARCARAGVPFVMGPLNGGLPWPRQFDRERRREREWLSYVRSFYRFLPGQGRALRAASAIICGSASTREQIPAKYRDKTVYVPENAVDPSRFGARRTRPASPPIRCAFVGRLVPYKGADMLLEAAAPLIREGLVRVDILGDGPQMPELVEIVRREGIEAGATLRGWVEHGQVGAILAECDLLTFPSIREFGGGVVAEAMASGLVPVIVDYGGPAEIATARTGYLIPLGGRAEIVERLRAVLARIAADPAQIEPKSLAAARRIDRCFTWAAKADQIAEVYRWVLGQRADKPDFPTPLPDEPEPAPALAGSA